MGKSLTSTDYRSGKLPVNYKPDFELQPRSTKRDSRLTELRLMARSRLREDGLEVVADGLRADPVIVCDLLGIESLEKRRRYAQLRRREPKDPLEGIQRKRAALRGIADQQEATRSLEDVTDRERDRIGLQQKRKTLGSLQQDGSRTRFMT